ncbi:MAG: response regulator [Oscillospiraceae bacterium]
MVYLLEDDDSIRKLVIYGMQTQGYEAEGFACPSAFWKGMTKQLPALILLDIMLPEEDGLSVLKKLRSAAATEKIPVIMLTAKNTEYDRVIGLDNGADDFICKPFGMMELVARVRAVLRRTQPVAGSKSYRVGELYVNPSEHLVQVEGQDVLLTYKEFEILCLLLENQVMVLTRSALMDRVWGCELERENRTLDVHIRTLRAKLGPMGKCIETVRASAIRSAAAYEEEARIRKKIFGNSFLLCVIVLVLCAVLFVGAIYRYYETQVFAELASEASYAGHGVECSGVAYLQSLHPEARITWVDANGDVLYDTQAPAAEMENHAGREEIRQALETGTGKSVRDSSTLLTNTLYYALRLDDGTVLRVACQQQAVLEMLQRMIQPVLLGVLLALALSAAFSYGWPVASLARSTPWTWTIPPPPEFIRSCSRC